MEEFTEAVDAHHHLWKYPSKSYMLDELLEDAATVPRVVQTVYVECGSFWHPTGPAVRRSLGETTRVRDLALESESRSGPVIAGVVAHANLRLGTRIRGILQDHVEAAEGRLVGIRDVVAWDQSSAIRPAHTRPPAELLMDRRFREGAAEVAKAGLAFDAWLYQTQLGELLDFARALPDLRIIVDHLGGPLAIGPYAGQRDNILQAWRQALAPLARCQNVTVKLGGLGMSLYGLKWHHQTMPLGVDEVVSAWGDPVRWCIDTFGPDRCMFESNFPVDRPSIGYKTLWATFDRLAERLEPSERHSLFAGTARRVYRLSEAGRSCFQASP